MTTRPAPDASEAIYTAGVRLSRTLRPVTRSNASVIGPLIAHAAQALENQGADEKEPAA